MRKRSYRFITEEFTEELKSRFAELGFNDLSVVCREVENHDQDPLVIEIYYPTLTSKEGYLKPAVLVEVGSRSLKEPFTHRSFNTIISEVFADRPFADKPITIPVVNPERTFLEKIFLLHEEFQKDSDKIRVERLSRHLYDIERLMQTEYAEIALRDGELYNTIVMHRRKFTPISGIDYNNHSPDKICIIPPENVMKYWEQDYQTMTQTMIYGDFLSFQELIKRLTGLQKRINVISLH